MICAFSLDLVFFLPGSVCNKLWITISKVKGKPYRWKAINIPEAKQPY